MAARIRHFLTLPPIWTSVLVTLSPMDVVSICIAFRIEMSQVEKERRLNPVSQVLENYRWSRCQRPHLPICVFLGRDLVKPFAELSRNNIHLKRSSPEIVLLLVVGCLTEEGSTMLQCREEILSTLVISGGVIHQQTTSSNHRETSQVVFFPRYATSIHVVHPQLNPACPRSGIIYLKSSGLEAFVEKATTWLIFQSHVPLQSTAVYKDSFVNEHIWWRIEHHFFLFQLHDAAAADQRPISLFLVNESGVRRLRLPDIVTRTLKW